MPKYIPRLPTLQSNLVHELRRHRVRFLVIGGRAMIARGVQRSTADLDLFLSPEEESRRGLAAFFGKHRAAPHGTTWLELVSTPNKLFQFPGPADHQADLLTSIDGIDFAACMARSEEMVFGDQPLQVACVADLISMKEVSRNSGNVPEAKERDAADIALLSALMP